MFEFFQNKDHASFAHDKPVAVLVKRPAGPLGLIIALGIVALGLPAAFAGLFGVLAHIDRYNAGIATVREAQLNVAGPCSQRS